MLKRATPEEELRIYEQQKRDAKATIIRYLDDVIPYVHINRDELLDTLSCLEDELREMCSR